MINRCRCPSCDLDAIETIEHQTFGFAVGTKVVDLEVYVPVITCHTCGQFTDYRADEIRESAIDEYIWRSKQPY